MQNNVNFSDHTWLICGICILLLLIAVCVVVLLSRRLHRDYQRRMDTLCVEKEHETFEAKMRFFVNLVHEIRTPLTLISIPLEQMAESAENGTIKGEENKRHIASMQRNVNYLLGIINQLLDFRKAQDGKEVRLATSCHDVKSRLTEICRRFEHPMDAIGKHISLIMPQQEVMAVFDVDKTDRVIMNLIGNAVKYSRSRVDVTLAEPKDGTVRILVADDGPGIAPHEREHIFDTYYQIGNDNLAASLGTGLGLTYAKLIACAHGGDITVDNNEYGGATFTLTFPAKYVSGDGHSVSAGAAAQAAAPLHSREISVLLVDDNRELLATVSDALRKSYTVYTAANAAEAIEMLELKDNIDVIISDFMMPGMSGAELCRKVKDDQRFGHIPFIILTAKTDTEAKVEGMACGADVYIEKPFAIRQLTLQIANIINTREQNMARVASAATGSAVTGVPLAADDDEPSLNRVDAEFLKTLDDYIRDNISEEEFSIDVMAKQMNMSRSSFYRKLKSVTSMTPVDYLKNYRLDYSAQLLLDGVRVTEVAAMSGFTSSSYFAKCFKAKFGMIPKEYVASKGGKMPPDL